MGILANGLVNIWDAVDRQDTAAIDRFAKLGGDLEQGILLYGYTPLPIAAR
jgi:hypothetical protein